MAKKNDDGVKAKPVDLHLKVWLAERGLTCTTLVHEPTPDQRKRWGVRGPVRYEYGKVYGPDGEPRDGGQRSVFVDDTGTYLLVESWTIRSSERARVWHVLTNAPTDAEPGSKIAERYTVMARKQAERSVRKQEKGGKGEAAHRAKMAAKGKPAVTAGSTMSRMADRNKAAGAAKPTASPKPKAAAATATAKRRKATTAGRRVGHPKMFGKYAYCAASRALGVGLSKAKAEKLGLGAAVEPFTTQEATLVFAAMDPPIKPAPGSVSATLRDIRVTPPELTAAEWRKLEGMRRDARKVIAAEGADAKGGEKKPNAKTTAKPSAKAGAKRGAPKKAKPAAGAVAVETEPTVASPATAEPTTKATTEPAATVEPAAPADPATTA